MTKKPVMVEIYIPDKNAMVLFNLALQNAMVTTSVIIA